MPGRLLVLLLLLAPAFAGCLAAPAADLAPLAHAGRALLVQDADGRPVADAAVTLLYRDVAVARGSTGAEGALLLPDLGIDRVLVAATGFSPREATLADALAAPVVLVPAGEVSADDAAPLLRMLPPHDFGSVALGPTALCGARNTCGLSEPVIEVAGDGSVYASATCCIGLSPPVWVSRDGGATWITLDTPGVREAVGIEGDFAVDDAGNVYFTDILVGALWITAWDKDGAWLHTSALPFEPLVDRPWVRAGADGVVYFLYNTGVDGTNFHVSTDHGRTFSPVPLKKFPAPLGTLAQGPERDHLWVVDGMRLYESADGGATWSAGEEIPTPGEGRGYMFAVPVVDEAGRVLVAYDWGSAQEGYAIHAALREPDGAWRLERVSRPNATHVMPWPAAGPDGGFVVAWYGADAEAASPDALKADSPWHVFLAATHDAGATWQTVKADPEALMTGPMNRRLLDFLQVDLAPDGAAHLVYAHNRDGSNEERTLYARTTVGLGLAPQVFPNGPKPEAGTEGSGGALPPLDLARA